MADDAEDSKDKEKSLSVSAESLRHYETRIQGTNLQFYYKTENAVVSGEASSSEAHPALHLIEFDNLRVKAEGFGEMQSNSGTLNPKDSTLILQDVRATFDDPPMSVKTEDARLTLDSRGHLSLETGELKGKLPARRLRSP